ncbi:hypothetical protein CTAYLR_006322 [Chrysophaeum taylorii]|uniref:aspartate transaminase n=1 Tax=Chrysophaeum taylorii TaxID=2483200 RepID=A0AAD7UAE6_9STRA|nr:hypothetical protein CTAYLR_006322 [Chrysophaeum taylorii]
MLLSSSSSAQQETCAARWTHVGVPPADPILGLKVVFRQDPFTSSKIDLTVGAYRTNDGEPWVLPAVRVATERLLTADHEYLPIDGLPAFTRATQRLMYGDDVASAVTVQTLSGTGAVRLSLEFLKRFFDAPLYLPRITWSNHFNIARDAGFADPRTYAYLDDATSRLDFESMLADLDAAPDGSIVLLHLCAHNPTGVDLTLPQWEILADLFARKSLLPLFDSAYLGFATGDLDRDAKPFRLFFEKGLAPWACVSFSKNFGLYSERVGALHATVRVEERDAVLGHLKKIARAMYSNPPAFGARIVSTVLEDPDLYASWLDSLHVMSDRIFETRGLLRSHLENATRDHDWDHITSQIGMFCFTGLTKSQVLELREKHHVYMLDNGRVSMAGVNTRNVEPLAAAIAAVLED